MPTERVTRYVRLVVDASGAKSGGREVRRALSDINKSAKSTAATMDGLRRSLLAGFAGIGVTQGILENLFMRLGDSAIKKNGVPKRLYLAVSISPTVRPPLNTPLSKAASSRRHWRAAG